MKAVELCSLTKRFGRTEALRGVSLAVEPGEIHGLLGPNGSGKTTTIACALGLMRPTRGEATILGHPARRMHANGHKVGVVFDEADVLEGLSARENLEYTLRLLGRPPGRGADEALQLVGLGSLAGRRAGALSLGQQKRLAVARALLGKRELLVLDEPLSGLDALGVQTMLELFRELAANGTTLVLSSHRMREMQTVLTHASFLVDGQVARTGTLAQLLGTDTATYLLEFEPLENAEGLLRDMDGIELLDSPPTKREAPRLRIRTNGTPIGAVNRALVQAGCTVNAIVPERQDLATVFHNVLAERGGRPT